MSKYKGNFACNNIKVIKKTYHGKNCAIVLTKKNKQLVYELDSIKSE